MFGKMLAAVGIGGARIQTVLDQDEVTVGGRITGTIHIAGGTVDQSIEGVFITLATAVQHEHDDRRWQESHDLNTVHVSTSFLLLAGSHHEIRFAIDVPLHTPVTLDGGEAVTWLRTRLAIQSAVDVTDTDAIVVHPVPVMVDALNALINLGFELVKCDVEHRPCWHEGHGLVQEFEFRPSTRATCRFDEVELVFLPDEFGGLTLMVEVDRAARGLRGQLAEATGLDESWYRMSIPGDIVGPGEEPIRQALAGILF